MENQEGKADVKDKIADNIRNTLTIEQVAEYEVYSSWFGAYMYFGWMQWLSGKYFSWKAERKYKRYAKQKENQITLLTAFLRAKQKKEQ